MNWIQESERDCYFSPYGSFKNAFVIHKTVWWDKATDKMIPVVDVSSDIFHTLMHEGDKESVRGRGMPTFKTVEEAKAWCEKFWYNYLWKWMERAYIHPEDRIDLEAVLKKRVA